MSEVTELNCVGMRCPRPIIEVAKAAPRSAPGAVLRVAADDLAFESDVRAWIEHRDATLVSLVKQDGTVAVEIRLPATGRGAP